MNFPNVSTSGIQGIHTGMENLKRDAHEIASSMAKGGEDVDGLAKSLVDLNIDKLQVAASVKVVQAADETLGTLLNVLA